MSIFSSRRKKDKVCDKGEEGGAGRAPARGEQPAQPRVGEDVHGTYAKGLSPEEVMLVTLRDELYSKSWDRVLRDMKDRLKCRPYIFKLVSRIEEDVARIERLKEYEEKHGINLADYLRTEGGRR